MRNLFLLLIFLLTVQCNNTKQADSKDTQEKINENKVVGELIGSVLSSVEDRELELNMKFEFQVIEEYSFDIDNDNSKEAIIIEKIKDWNDPGDFHRIRIKKGNGKEVQFFNAFGWVVIGNYETQHVDGFSSNNLLNSKYVILQNAGDGNLLLFAFGYVYASQPGILSIINLSNKNEPKLIFNDNYYLFGFKDLNNDNIKELQVIKFDKEEFVGKEETFSSYQLKDGWLHKITN